MELIVDRLSVWTPAKGFQWFFKEEDQSDVGSYIPAITVMIFYKILKSKIYYPCSLKDLLVRCTKLICKIVHNVKR